MVRRPMAPAAFANGRTTALAGLESICDIISRADAIMRKKLIYYYLSMTAICNIGFVIMLIDVLYLRSTSHIWGSNTTELLIEGLKRDWQIGRLVVLANVVFPFFIFLLVIIVIFILIKNNTRSAWNVAPHLPTLVSLIGVVSFYNFCSVQSFVILTLPIPIWCSYTVWKNRHKPI